MSPSTVASRNCRSPWRFHSGPRGGPNRDTALETEPSHSHPPFWSQRTGAFVSPASCEEHGCSQQGVNSEGGCWGWRIWGMKRAADAAGSPGYAGSAKGKAVSTP